jgi:hypothetical protein
MLIEIDLNNNDAQALLRHCTEHQPNCGDFRENARLREALETLAAAIDDAMSPEKSYESSETIDPQLLHAAMVLFSHKESAVDWLSKPLQALGGKRLMDVPIEQALTLIGRLEHGFGA